MIRNRTMTSVSQKSTTNGSRALCVGCGEAIMERDAKDMATALSSHGYADINLITSHEATQTTMQNVTTRVLENVPVNGNVVLFFSCHATTDENETLWLLPHDAPAHARTPQSVGLNARQLRAACLACPANVLVVLDCCYSGAVAKDNLGRLSRKWQEGPGRVILTSSGPHDRTYYDDRSRNSPLTAILVRLLLKGSSHRTTFSKQLARDAKDYFSDRPYWGRSLQAEERGRDFVLSVEE